MTAAVAAPVAAPRPGSWARTAPAAVFAASLSVAVVVGAVPPWRATGALIVAAIALLPLADRTRLALVAVAAAPLALPALIPDHPGASPWAWAALVVAAGVGAMASFSRERAAVAGLCLVAGGVLAAKQVVAASALPAAIGVVTGVLALGWLGAALTFAIPADRSAALGLALAGVLGVGRGALVAREAATSPVVVASADVARYQAAGLWPVLEARADGDVLGTLSLVRLAPGRPWAGTAVTRREGAAVALAEGWDPEGTLDPDVAVAAAWALEARGDLGRAVLLLRRQPRMGKLAFHLSTLAHEAGDEPLAANAWSKAVIPDDVPERKPGDGVFAGDLETDSAAPVTFALDAPSEGIVVTARGEAWEGLPRLSVDVGGRTFGPVDVPVEGGRWTFDLPMSPGGWKVQARFLNDAQGDGGDRNLRDVRIVLR